MTPPPLRLAVHQFAPKLRAGEANALRIADAAARSDADLLVTPELSLTGYDVGDDVARLAVPLGAGAGPVAGLEHTRDVVVGLIERGEDAAVYNAAAHLRTGLAVHRHRKIYLPTYGMFDEGRYFGRGRRLETYEPAAGWRAGLLVCEDLWHPALVYLLAARGIQLLVALSAAPGRGVREGGEAGGRFASWDVWERIARSAAQLYGIYVALANRVGAEGGVVFAGGSLIVGPMGDVLARARDDGEDLIAAEISLEEVARARRPYAHARDDDPVFTLRALERLVADAGL